MLLYDYISSLIGVCDKITTIFSKRHLPFSKDVAKCNLTIKTKLLSDKLDIALNRHKQEQAQATLNAYFF